MNYTLYAVRYTLYEASVLRPLFSAFRLLFSVFRLLSSVFCHLSSVFCPLHLSRELYKSPLFMQNKPKVKIGKMNVSYYITNDYENKSNWTLGKRGKNKPKQSQSVVSLSNLFPGFPFCKTSQNGVSPIILVSLNWLCIISFSVMVT